MGWTERQSQGPGLNKAYGSRDPWRKGMGRVGALGTGRSGQWMGEGGMWSAVRRKKALLSGGVARPGGALGPMEGAIGSH